METNFDALLEKLGASLKNIASTETVVGETFMLGDFACKPVMKIGLGFGSGAGSGESEQKGSGVGNGTAAGAGIGMTPMGFLVSSGDRISYIPTAPQSTLQTVFDQVPPMLDKLLEMQKARKEDKNKE